MVLLLPDWQLTLFVGCRSYDILVSIDMRSTLAEQHHLQTRRFACAGSTFFNMMEHTCEIRAQDLWTYLKIYACRFVPHWKRFKIIDWVYTKNGKTQYHVQPYGVALVGLAINLGLSDVGVIWASCKHCCVNYSLQSNTMYKPGVSLAWEAIFSVRWSTHDL